MTVIEEDIRDIISADLPWGKLKNASILVTGATGLVMTYMVYALLALVEGGVAELQIYLLVRSEEKVKRKYGKYLNCPNLHLIYGDICEELKFECDIDYIIAAAGISSGSGFKKSPVETLRSNIIGTDNLLRLAVRKRVKKFLYLSSATVYGNYNRTFGGVEGILSEDSSGMVDFTYIGAGYVESKRVGELLCKSYLSEYDIPVVIARSCFIYSPESNDKTGSAFTDFFNYVLNEHDIAMNSDGSKISAFVYISDCIKGLLTIMLSGENGKIYNVATESVSIKELGEMFSEYTGGKSRLVLRTDESVVNSNTNNYILDTSKLRALGWEPKMRLKEGIARCIEGYREIHGNES